MNENILDKTELKEPMNLLKIDFQFSMLLLPGMSRYATRLLVDSCSSLDSLIQLDKEEGK